MRPRKFPNKLEPESQNSFKVEFKLPDAGGRCDPRNNGCHETIQDLSIEASDFLLARVLTKRRGKMRIEGA